MLTFVLLVLRPVALGISGALLGDKAAPREETPRPASDILRERYARGEITREQYREALVDVLKDYYVRGEITLEEFEARIEKMNSTDASQPNAGSGTDWATNNPNT